jgi:hypothetical protein
LIPFYWRNDFVAVEQSSRLKTEEGCVLLPELYERHVRFATELNETVSRQCVVEVLAARVQM